MKLFWMLVIIILLVSVILPSLSFPTGAPQAACQTLAPNATQHGAQPQVTNIPYILNLSAFYDQATDQMVYTPGTVYNSKLQAIFRHVQLAAVDIILYRQPEKLEFQEFPGLH